MLIVQRKMAAVRWGKRVYRVQVPVFADILGLSGANCRRPISKTYDGRREQYENPAPKSYSMRLPNWKGMILALLQHTLMIDAQDLTSSGC